MNDQTDEQTVLAGHQGQLERLRLLEVELDEVRSKLVNAEVDVISVESGDAKPAGIAGLTPAQSLTLVKIKSRQRRLKAALETDAGDDERERVQLAAAYQHLSDWLDDSVDTRSLVSANRIRLCMSLLSIASLVAAFTVHWAFLILLVPIGAASASMWTGGDRQWKRAGHQRAFEQTGLSAPKNWNEEGVRRRLDELRSEIETRERLANEPVAVDLSGMSDEAIALELVDLEVAEQALGVDFDALEPAERDALLAQAERHESRIQLGVLERQKRELGDQAESIRTDIYRYLQRHGAVQQSGQADCDALAAGLSQVTKQVQRSV